MTCRCLRCGNVWNPASKNPLRCPRCKSTRWNKVTVTHKCLRCGAEWEQRSDKFPKYCPACHSAMWNEEPKTFTCPKCGRTMQLRSNSRTNLCPVCDAYTARGRMELFSPRPYFPGDMSLLWSDNKGLSVYYCDGSGYGIVFWHGDIIGSRRIEPLLRGRRYIPGENITDFDEELENEIKGICKKILSDHVNLEKDADEKTLLSECVGLFREGMSPVSIALKLKMAFTEVMDAITGITRQDIGNADSIGPAFVGGMPERMGGSF